MSINYMRNKNFLPAFNKYNSSKTMQENIEKFQNNMNRVNQEKMSKFYSMVNKNKNATKENNIINTNNINNLNFNKEINSNTLSQEEKVELLDKVLLFSKEKRGLEEIKKAQENQERIIKRRQDTLNKINLVEGDQKDLYDWSILFNDRKPIKYYVFGKSNTTKASDNNTNKYIENMNNYKYNNPLNNLSQKINNKTGQNKSRQKKQSSIATALIDAKPSEVYPLFYKNGTVPSSKQEVVRTKSVYSFRDPGENFYLSDDYSKYFTISLEEFQKLNPLIKAKKKLNKNYVNKLNKQSHEKEAYFNYIFNNEDSKLNKSIKRSVSISFRDIFLANHRQTPEPLIQNIFCQTHCIDLDKINRRRNKSNPREQTKNPNINIDNDNKIEEEEISFNSEKIGSEKKGELNSGQSEVKNDEQNRPLSGNSKFTKKKTKAKRNKVNFESGLIYDTYNPFSPCVKFFNDAAKRMNEKENKFYIENMEQTKNYIKNRNEERKIMDQFLIDNLSIPINRTVPDDPETINQNKQNIYNKTKDIYYYDYESEDSEIDNIIKAKAKLKKKIKKQKNPQVIVLKKSNSQIISLDIEKLRRKIAKEENIPILKPVENGTCTSPENITSNINTGVNSTNINTDLQFPISSHGLGSAKNRQFIQYKNLVFANNNQQLENQQAIKNDNISHDKIQGSFNSNEYNNFTNENTQSTLCDYIPVKAMPYKTDTKIQNVAYSKIDKRLKEMKSRNIMKNDSLKMYYYNVITSSNANNYNFSTLNSNLNNNNVYEYQTLQRPASSYNFKSSKKTFMDYINPTSKKNYVRNYHQESQTPHTTTLKDSENGKLPDVKGLKNSQSCKKLDMSPSVNYIYINQYVGNIINDEIIYNHFNLYNKSDVLNNNFINKKNMMIYNSNIKYEIPKNDNTKFEKFVPTYQITKDLFYSNKKNNNKNANSKTNSKNKLKRPGSSINYRSYKKINFNK